MRILIWKAFGVIDVYSLENEKSIKDLYRLLHNSCDFHHVSGLLPMLKGDYPKQVYLDEIKELSDLIDDDHLIGNVEAFENFEITDLK